MCGSKTGETAKRYVFILNYTEEYRIQEKEDVTIKQLFTHWVMSISHC